MVVRHQILTLFLLSISLAALSQIDANRKKMDLRAGFFNPDRTSRPKVYWWWLNGFVDRARIVEELKSMHDLGIGGIDIFEIGARPAGVVPAGPPFMSDSSLDDIAFAIHEAAKYGMDVGLNLASSWNAGGTWVRPEHAAKTLYFSKVDVSSNGSLESIFIPFPTIEPKDKNGKRLSIELKPNGRPIYSKEVAVLAIPEIDHGKWIDTSSILNLSHLFDGKNHKLDCKIPRGKWSIYRYVCSNTGEQLMLPSPKSGGPIIDHFDKNATEQHFMYFINKLQDRIGDLKHTSLKNLYLASFEARSVVWTGSLEEEFRKNHGYDIYKFLPALFCENIFQNAAQEAFTRDLKFTISELMINNHYKKGKEIANRYGLKLISESGGPGPPLHNVPVEAIKALGALDIPRGEFWINHSQYDSSIDSIDLLMLVKEIAAASNIYRKRITELEAFTSFQNWQEGPGDMKHIGDRAFCEGMNRAVIHGFTHNPAGMGYPGIVYGAGTHFNDRNTWWPKARPFVDYLTRISYILQETDFFADVLYYYGDKVPNFATPKNTRFAVGSGYDYEIINSEILLDSLSFKDGWFILTNGAKFRILAVDSISPENKLVHRKLREFKEKGGFISTNQVDSIQFWLRKLNLLPDFDYSDKASNRLDYMKSDKPLLDFIHEKKGDRDFYFVRNTSNKWVSRNCSFRQIGKSPEIWHPVNATIEPVTIFKQSLDGRTTLPLSFAPFESYFVVFETTGRKPQFSTFDFEPPEQVIYYQAGSAWSHKAHNTENKITGRRMKFTSDFSMDINGKWLLEFDPKWGGPPKPFLDSLRSWTLSTLEGVKYYSGTGTYTKQFDFEKPIDKNRRFWLDLGDVARVGDVWLNGEPLGITWTPPYRYDITNVIRSGINDIKIEVINTWSNRIIGDLKSTNKFTKTNLTQRGSRELTWSETPLLKSGLLGPVVIYSAQKVGN